MQKLRAMQEFRLGGDSVFCHDALGPGWRTLDGEAAMTGILELNTIIVHPCRIGAILPPQMLELESRPVLYCTCSILAKGYGQNLDPGDH